MVKLVRASANINAMATQSTHPCAPLSHESICETQPAPSARGPRSAQPTAAPPSMEKAGRPPMIIP